MMCLPLHLWTKYLLMHSEERQECVPKKGTMQDIPWRNIIWVPRRAKGREDQLALLEIILLHCSCIRTLIKCTCRTTHLCYFSINNYLVSLSFIFIFFSKMHIILWDATFAMLKSRQAPPCIVVPSRSDGNVSFLYGDAVSVTRAIIFLQLHKTSFARQSSVLPEICWLVFKKALSTKEFLINWTFTNIYVETILTVQWWEHCQDILLIQFTRCAGFIQST